MRQITDTAGKRCALAFAWVCAAIAVNAAIAQSPVCKYVDADGNVVFSNLPPEKGHRKVSCMGADEPRKSAPASPAAASRSAPTPAGFPRVDAETQKSRDDMRRKVLADELAAEEKLLGDARAGYANGAPVPLPEEQVDAEKYRERIARLRQTVQLHERNIEALKKELGGKK